MSEKDSPSQDPTPTTEAGDAGGSGLTRRALITGAATVAGGALASTLPASMIGQGAPAVPAAPPVPTPVVVPADPTKVLGGPTSAVSVRSPFVVPARAPTGAVSGSSLTPLHQFMGSITPTDLQFERHHAGVPMIDPDKYRLLVHGLVERPTMFTLSDLMTFPSESRIHFLECSGNGRLAFKGSKPDLTPQNMDGLFANGEWTGVPVKTVLKEVGVRSGAVWSLAEGGDAALLSRSVPVDKLMDDAMFVYALNGEPLRPAAGYPVRLLLPGWEGNTNVKWIRRLELIREPNMSKDETSRYTDPLPNGTARQFSFDIDAKSALTYPTYPVKLAKPGWVQLSGLAWSGRGKISRVDISVDGGATWTEARLHGQVLPKAAVRFTQMWEWKGGTATIMCRATDETGYVQPTLEVYRSVRGPGTDYHYNHIRAWVVQADGQVVFGSAT